MLKYTSKFQFCPNLCIIINDDFEPFSCSSCTCCILCQRLVQMSLYLLVLCMFVWIPFLCWKLEAALLDTTAQISLQSKQTII